MHSIAELGDGASSPRDWDLAWFCARVQAYYWSPEYDRYCFNPGSRTRTPPTSSGESCDPREAILNQVPGKYHAVCPVHDDGSPSLGIQIGEDRILVNCLAGCETKDVLKALGLGWKDLFLTP